MLLELRVSCLPRTVPLGTSLRLINAIAAPGLTVCPRVLGEAASVGNVPLRTPSPAGTVGRRLTGECSFDDSCCMNIRNY